MLMHHLVARMGHQNAVVIGQKTLAKLMGCNTRTVQRAIDDLVKDRWIQVVQIGQHGTVNAYVVNAAVAWGESREHIGRLAVFHATVVADADDQSAEALEHKDLRKVPIIYPPEEALPAGDGDKGEQIQLPGFESTVIGPSLENGGHGEELEGVPTLPPAQRSKPS